MGDTKTDTSWIPCALYWSNSGIAHGGLMTDKDVFGQWLKQRRKALDFTREDLAQRIGCAVVTLKKIEAGERRPSKQIAELLGQHLNIPLDNRVAFVTF